MGDMSWTSVYMKRFFVTGDKKRSRVLPPPLPTSCNLKENIIADAMYHKGTPAYTVDRSTPKHNLAMAQSLLWLSNDFPDQGIFSREGSESRLSPVLQGLL